MNANEVTATLAGEGVHPNDHVNMGQSSNDVFPSAVHLAALGEIAHDLLPALERLAPSLERKAVEVAMPRLGQIPLGGTATGTGLNTHAEFAPRVREYLSRETGLTVSAPADHFEAQAARDGLVEVSGALKVVAVSLTKIDRESTRLNSSHSQ